MKRMRVHSNHALEIKEVCQEDVGLYTVVLRNRAASLEKKLNITLVVNGTRTWRRLRSAENMTNKNCLLYIIILLGLDHYRGVTFELLRS